MKVYFSISWLYNWGMENREIEARFLDVRKEELVQKLKALGAEDLGEELLQEVIIYGPESKWKDENRVMKIRKERGKITLVYKQNHSHTVDGTEEIELEINDFEKGVTLLEKAGLPPSRRQEKRRYTFRFEETTIDIDTWPKIPTYVELEGPSENVLRETAKKLGLDWGKAEFRNPRTVIEDVYHIPLGTLRWFTFDRVE